MNKTQAIYGVVLIGLLLYLETVVEFTYLTKQLVRIPFMIVVPFFLLRYSQSSILNDLTFSKVSFKDVRPSILAGLVVFFGAIGGYTIIYFFSDPSSITEALLAIDVTLQNIIWVSLYMTTFNVILEEFFFRGFVYMNLRKTNEIMAYLVSSFLFAAFHIGIVSAYFEPLIFILLLFGLMLVGAFLIFINRFGKSLINSCIVHIFADLAMFSIGFYLFLQ
ncbi:CPBP family intramembrane glutamic endopeptidase [Candidatus Xianfuyuplasma coldseepsis]|uniref:CPBP family intramembrane metalloprotease n=1 Tax=Candidatus Xianfuyuplasma coldseepsis TaxID=2782163 RepID=A0A7L7KS98_9MOLU|nr:CPBP family intramembrane glutamic endopeptidase [Xianfuyuplasma coldseepsis]QMS85289.1 CPBP family intramembrane metalloprotease [Xianfuyuplasma coldseepsis]